MHLPIAHQAHLAAFEDENEDLNAQLADSGSQEEEGSQGSKGSGECALDRPGKDIPCPRCKSMNTKFCYYNNYSVNQPRHFCRECQRYWTVGGTLRNVPVGGGSRKKPRSRSRSDPYYRPGSSPAHGGDGENEHHHPGLQAMGGMPEMALHPDSQVGLGFGDRFGDQFAELPFLPSQLSSLLQYALQQNHGMYSQFFDQSSFPDEEAELQALYEAQAASSGYLSNAAAMLSSGLFMPDLEPAHLALMHKATMWAEHQRLQSLARRQTAQAVSAWEERECKPSVTAQMHRQSAAFEQELRHRQQAASLHRRPGFWETALMHSRPSKRPGSHTWDDAKSAPAPAPTQSPLHGSSTVEEEATAPSNAANFSHGYEDSSSWAPDALDAEIYY